MILATTRGAGILQNERFTPIVDTLSIEYRYGGAAKRRDGSIYGRFFRNEFLTSIRPSRK